MLKREIRSLNNKLRNVRDKREMVMQERRLLQERIETLVGSIGNEVESRRGLRKEINEMNEAFKEEIMDMAREQKAANELEDCYFSDDEELVVNTHKRDDLGAVHIFRKHLYSTKIYLISKFFTKNGFFCQNKRISFSTLHFDENFML